MLPNVELAVFTSKNTGPEPYNGLANDTDEYSNNFPGRAKSYTSRHTITGNVQQ